MDEDSLDKCFRKLKQIDFSNVKIPSSGLDWGSEGSAEELKKILLEQGWTPVEYINEFNNSREKGRKVTPQQILLSLRCRPRR